MTARRSDYIKAAYLAPKLPNFAQYRDDFGVITLGIQRVITA